MNGHLNDSVINLKAAMNTVYSLPNDKILALTKLKAFADHKFNAAKIVISFYDKAENIVGKEENAGCQHFLLFPHCFQKLSVSRSLKVGIVW